MRYLYFYMHFYKNSLSLVFICENINDAGWKADFWENSVKKGRKIAKILFSWFLGSRAVRLDIRAARIALRDLVFSHSLVVSRAVLEVRDFRGRYLCIRSDRHNLRKRSGESISCREDPFAPRCLSDLLPYKFSFPFFGSAFIRERGIQIFSAF